MCKPTSLIFYVSLDMCQYIDTRSIHYPAKYGTVDSTYHLFNLFLLKNTGQPLTVRYYVLLARQLSTSLMFSVSQLLRMLECMSLVMGVARTLQSQRQPWCRNQEVKPWLDNLMSSFSTLKCTDDKECRWGQSQPV